MERYEIYSIENNGYTGLLRLHHMCENPDMHKDAYPAIYIDALIESRIY